MRIAPRHELSAGMPIKQRSLHIGHVPIQRGNNMIQRTIGFPTANPFILWSSLAVKTAEMMMASSQVIRHRTGRIASAGLLPDERDRREFHLMGQEKLEATAESLQAIGLRVLSFQQQFAMLAFRQMVAAATGWMSLAGSRTLAQSAQAQGELVRNTMSHSAATLSHVGDSVARVAHKGLKPIHSRATANARRLARVKK
jgi:hypothetical protein